ncbi:zf-HC2 domain-containing protein [bacterium]|nr:zf-HC2 domain-containing protein [bacterium]
MSRRSWLHRIFAMRCDDAAELISASLDEELSAFDRFTMKSHLLLCRSCCRFRKQLSFLRLLMRKTPTLIVENESPLSMECRSRIQRAMTERNNENQGD